MGFAFWKEKISLQGTMPQRALLRLQRAHVSVYDVEKTDVDRIEFCVKKQDLEKVLAIYPQEKHGFTAYTAQRMGGVGVGKTVDFLKRRVGLLIGGLIALTGILYSDRYVFSVEFVGTDVYRRETLIALEEVGIIPFFPYKKGGEDIVCARLLALDGVEFCSVKKSGSRVVVETRLSPFPTRVKEQGAMHAKHTGRLISLTVLRGTPLAVVGQEIRVGDLLVGDWFSTQDGGQVCVEPIARASIACVYETELPETDETRAFATAYLGAGLESVEIITKKEITKTDVGYCVRLEYTVVESINF